jgi:choline kinase
MKAIILSAGQGNRLLPLTEHTPKCLLPVQDDASVLEFQLRVLAACGVTEAAVIVGFGADQIEECLAERPVAGIEARAVFNPFYAVSDNLATAWLARSEMDQDFVLVNGDTLFTEDVLRRLLSAPVAPLTLAINVKDRYDADDMKVSLAGRRLKAVGKRLDSNMVHGESIGLMTFRGRGVKAFRDALDRAIRSPEGLGRWYLSVVNDLTDWLSVQTADITGMWWGEIDCPEDLTEVRKALSGVSAHATESGSRARYAK